MKAFFYAIAVIFSLCTVQAQITVSPAGGSAPSDTAYNATTWDNVTTVAPSKNAVRDILETIIASVVAPSDVAYDATSWDSVTTIAPTKNAVRDKIEAVVASIPPAHSGGVIGTASFDPSGASIGSPVYTGIISSAAYNTPGDYTVVFTPNQPDVNYGVSVALPFTAEQITSWGFGDKTVISCQILVNQTVGGIGGGALGIPIPFDPGSRITITVTRQSQ